MSPAISRPPTQFVHFIAHPQYGPIRAWFNDELDETIKERDWTKQKVSVPLPEQAWFLKTLCESWLKLEDETILETVTPLRLSLSEMSMRQVWSPESQTALAPDLRQRMIERIKKAYPQVESEPMNQPKLMIEYLQGKKE